MSDVIWVLTGYRAVYPGTQWERQRILLWVQPAVRVNSFETMPHTRSVVREKFRAY
jgi:hypothetical protein